jgi:hypothetical protein
VLLGQQMGQHAPQIPADPCGTRFAGNRLKPGSTYPSRSTGSGYEFGLSKWETEGQLFADAVDLCGASLRAETLPRYAGCVLVFGHVAENAERGVCAELVQVAPIIEGSSALHNLFSLATLAPGAFLRSGALGLDALVAHDFLQYLLSVRSTARKTYGKTTSGGQITDGLVDVLAEKAEAGYEIEERIEGLTEPMDR